MGPILPRSFYERDTAVVAKALLGMHLALSTDHGTRVGRIVETEAYLGPRDLAAHSSKGRTARTEVMFGPPAHAYVYFIYGMHHCVNVVVGEGHAILIRSVEALSGFPAGIRTDGPGRVCKHFGIDKRFNALSLLEPPLTIHEGEPLKRIQAGPRVGVDYSGPYWSRRKLRFWDPTNRWIR